MSDTKDNSKAPPTPEEIAAYKKKMTEFYEGELPFLRLKAEYERLNSEIAQDRLKEVVANHKLMEHEAHLKQQAAEATDKK